jgi:hypothetical protein
VKRWLIVTLGLALALAAGWVWLTGSGDLSRLGVQKPAEPAHADIGEKSKEQLREILRKADEGK